MYVEAEISTGEDGNERLIDTLSLIDAVMPDVVSSRKQAPIKAEPGASMDSPSAPPVEGIGGNDPMDVDGKSEMDCQLYTTFSMVILLGTTEISAEKSTVLKGHDSEVFICAWNPKQDLLASGSGDSTARIWNLTKGGEATVEVLKHCIKMEGKEVPSNKDVTSLDWNCDGKLLATGSYDGYAR